MTAPPLGAVPLSVTLPDATAPPVTLLVSDTDEIASGAMVTLAVFESPAYEAVMVTLVALNGDSAEMVKLLLETPAGIETELGTDAELLLAVRETTAPPLGAGPESLIVPVPLRSLITVVGETETDESLVGVTVIFAVLVTPA